MLTQAAHIAPTSRTFHPPPIGAFRQITPRPLSHAEAPFSQAVRLIGTCMSCPRNAEIFGESESADYLYKTVSGCVRTYRILNDGRRQIDGFYLPGEVFGLGIGAHHAMSADAIADSTVLVVKRSALNAIADRDPAIGRELLWLTAQELRRVQDRILLLIKSAQERVAGFLLEMADRFVADEVIDLPMSRQDIADYLGLTIETVSRTLSAFERSATIALPTSRRIVLRNRAALNRMIG
jgi:CRP/FNR family transcriptional regulator, nitrogen fixation regulation protein